MTRQLLIGAAIAAVLGLSACDQVRLPGINPAGSDDHEDISREFLDTLEAEAPADPDPEAAADEIILSETAGTPDATEAADETSDRDDDEDILQPQSVLAALDPTLIPTLPTLGMLNATLCGLGQDAPETPTAANVAGATELEEKAFAPAAVNGLSASLASFPGIVKIEPRTPRSDGFTTLNHCSATRIADNWFVTAAHCVDDPFDEIRLIGESENLRSPLAKTTTASLAICHAGYNGVPTGYANDLALVRLGDDHIADLQNVPIARFGETATPLAPANYPVADMAGWGLTHYGGQLSNDLLSATLSITAAGPAIIQVASRGGSGPCAGDSGGPLYVTESDGSKTLVGVLSVVEQNSTGEFCAGEYNGRYTNLQGYSDWIDNIISRCDANPETCR